MKVPPPYEGVPVAAVQVGRGYPEVLVFWDKTTGQYAYLGPEGWAFWHYRSLDPLEALDAIRALRLAGPRLKINRPALDQLLRDAGYDPDRAAA